MKTPTSPHKFIGILAAALIPALSFTALAQDDKEKVKVKDDKVVVKTDEGKAKIDKAGNVIKIKGPEGAEALAKARAELGEEKAEAFQRSLVTGYAVPEDHYGYLRQIPKGSIKEIPNAREDLEYRAYGNMVYGVNPGNRTIVDVYEVSAD